MIMTIGFSRAKRWYQIGSKVIATAEKRPFSHAYVRYEDQSTSIEVVAQASHGFINEMRYEVFKESNEVIYEYSLDVNPEISQKIMLFIKSNLGVGYSYSQIILIAIKKLFKMEINVSNNDSEFICSEFVGRLWEIAGFNKIDKQDYLTPSDLHKQILAAKEQGIAIWRR